MAGWLLFLYTFSRNEVIPMGYDNDIILLLLDDDLFWRHDDVELLQSQPQGITRR